MGNNRWIFALVVVIALIAGVSILGFKNKDKNNTSQGTKEATSQGTNNNQPSSQAEYFSDDASVMYFYSDYCSWCQKEKEILAKLGTEGYKVKPMDVGKDQSMWEKYQIKGTPTFIAKNGDRSEGYKDYDPLKSWLDSHK